MFCVAVVINSEAVLVCDAFLDGLLMVCVEGTG